MRAQSSTIKKDAEDKYQLKIQQLDRLNKVKENG
jgi:hypothetical protein